MLGEDPEKITLGHVYEVISRGELRPTWQTGDPEQGCPVSSNTQGIMDYIFKEAEDTYASFLYQFTVASVLQKIKAGV